MTDCCFPTIFNDTQRIDFTKNKIEAYERLSNSLKDIFDWDASRTPFPGLFSFQEEDAGVYFGREDDILNSIQHLESIRRLKQDRANLVLLLGASGSGKSSLVRAGILPRLKKDNNWLIIKPFRPKNDPISELSISLSEAYKTINRLVGPEEISKELTTKTSGLYSYCFDLLNKSKNKDATLLIVIDQAEELFSQDISSNNAQFLQILNTTIRIAVAQVIIITILRSNFLEKFQNSSLVKDTMKWVELKVQLCVQQIMSYKLQILQKMI